MPFTASRPSLHYVVSGAGPPVVFSHALGLDLHMWGQITTSIEERWTVVRYDTRNHGRSDLIQSPFTLDDLVDDAERLIDELKHERVSWVGLSLGGMIGLGLAIRHPGRIARLVVANTASTYPDDLRRGWIERGTTARTDGMPALVDFILRRSFSPAFLASGDDALSRTRQTVLAADARGYAACCDAIASLDYQQRLKQIRCPTLVICGDADEAVPVSWAQALTDAIPGAALAVIPGSGHLSATEYPRPFADLLERFL
ncbi:MAG TPA: alpha/beta fold hydrolase [Vicinamibacterales bacterium]|jgi:3-oxoadipate enol-lactonase|nr:alpha/beta fold hydrolase [Vicinamibacterales bacterium]